MKASVSFTLARGRNRFYTADSSKISTFYGVPIFDALVRRLL